MGIDELDQLRSNTHRLDQLLKRLEEILDDNRRFAGYVEKLIRSQSEASGNTKLVAQSITQAGYRIGAVELELANLRQALLTGGQIDTANLQVVAARLEATRAETSEKLDKLHKDITGQFPVQDGGNGVERHPVSRPPGSSAGALARALYEFRKAPRFSQILLVLLALAIAISGWLYHGISTGGAARDQVEERAP